MSERTSARVVVVTSGKGGVGKTTTTAAIGAALAHLGDKVVVVDFDVGLRNLHLLPASQTRDKDALTEEGVGKVIGDLREKFDWIVCDSPAGIERGATLAMRHAATAIIVTNPEVSSVRDSDRIIGLLDSKTLLAEKGERVQ